MRGLGAGRRRRRARRNDVHTFYRRVVGFVEAVSDEADCEGRFSDASGYSSRGELGLVGREYRERTTYHRE